MSLKHFVCLALLSSMSLVACNHLPSAPSGGQDVRGLPSLSRLSPVHLRPVANHVDGQRGSGSQATPEGDRRRFFHAESTCHVHAGGRRFQLWHQMESSATGRSRATTISSFRHSGTCATRCGVPTTFSPAPTGGWS